MEKNDKMYKSYLAVLQEELVPATGCTEPISIAFCAAKAREVLGMMPEKVDVRVSGNIIKNVKSVVVPNTNGLKGIMAAAAAGIVVGDASQEMEVIAHVDEAAKADIPKFMETAQFNIEPTYGEELLEVIVTVEAGGHSAMARVCKGHVNIVAIEKDGKSIYQADGNQGTNAKIDKSFMSVAGIVEFAGMADLADIKDILLRQATYNTAIAKEGIKNQWGANIGSILLSQHDDLNTIARAHAAAGSDARMSGCEMPVIIVSGSGNQGITASVPVIMYAEKIGASEEAVLRSLCVSDLVAIHLKTGIGALSAFCGAVCAGCGAGAGIAYLNGESYEAIAEVITNALGMVSGMVCDGAKPSCAAKIAASVDCGLLGYEMYKSGQKFYGGDGILGNDVEKTIDNIGRMGRLGMAETDHEILRIMTE